jgi:riboflavin-specific deaminase-like protein
MKKIETGCEKESYALLARHTAVPHLNRPHVTLTFAQSLDGIIGKPGSQLFLSCPQSLIFTHALRASSDAIMVGIGTVLNDRPSLTTRHVHKGSSGGKIRNASPVIVDRLLQTPTDSKFIDGAIILYNCVDKDRETQILDAGAKLAKVPLVDGGSRLDLAAALEILHNDFNIRSLMVEGGSRIIQSLIDTRLVDQLYITVCPLFVGSGVKAFNGDELTRLDDVGYTQFGSDVIVSARFGASG